MAHSVHINDASRRQLELLLGLTAAESEAVENARPFEMAVQALAVLPAAKAEALSGLEVEKIDINTIDPDRFKQITSLSDDVTDAIFARRPYFFLFELTKVPGVDADAFGRILPFFRTVHLHYKDKLSGSSVELTPKSSETVVRFHASSRELESALMGLRVKTKQLSEEGRYGLVQAEESESGTRVLSRLKDSRSVDAVLPAFDDESGARRYLDPEYLVVQFNEDVAESDRREVIDGAVLQIEKAHRVPGLYTLRVEHAGTNPGRLVEKLALINASDHVKFAEPLYLGFDDLEAASAFATMGAPVAPGDKETAAVILEVHEVESATDFAWNHNLIRLQDAWLRGKGTSDVVIAVIDTGADLHHPALSSRFVERHDENWNFADDDAVDPTDDNGHGTFVAGLLIGNGAAGVRGICPDCRVLPLRIPLTAGHVSYVERREAILYALGSLPPGKRLVINLSWKTSGDITLVRDAINTAESQGAVVVASAGNWPQQAGASHYPSDYPTVLSVGAVQPDSTRALYSYYEGGVDLAAPGGSGSEDSSTNIRSSIPGGRVGASFGTSFAAPHVAAVAALVLSLDSSLTPEQVRRQVLQACVPLPGEGLGHGLVDASAAVGAHVGDDGPPVSNGELEPDGDAPFGVLNALNTLPIDEIVERFDIPRIIARIIAARRPFQDVEDVRHIGWMTDERFERIASAGGGSGDTVDVNGASFEALVSEAGLPSITARLIVLRRPFVAADQLRGLLGMTEALLQSLHIN